MTKTADNAGIKRALESMQLVQNQAHYIVFSNSIVVKTVARCCSLQQLYMVVMLPFHQLLTINAWVCTEWRAIQRIAINSLSFVNNELVLDDLNA